MNRRTAGGVFTREPDTHMEHPFRFAVAKRVGRRACGHLPAVSPVPATPAFGRPPFGQ